MTIIPRLMSAFCVGTAAVCVILALKDYAGPDQAMLAGISVAIAYFVARLAP